MNAKNLIGGLLAGAAIGVAIGILLAPASGKETRKSLATGSRKLADSLAGSAEESLESLKGKFNMGVDEVTKRGKELINSTNERLKV
ncbi:MAG: YtxH domain-containing protein [Cyclobacteriaceae bacterium]